MKEYDLIVIGSGPGGYVAAIRAAQLGLATAIVEREHLGGICLNWGCIPTKSLLRSVEVLEQTQQANEYGVEVGPAKPNISKMVERSRSVSAQLNRGVEHLLKKNKVEIIWGDAVLTAPGLVSVEPTTKPPVEPTHPKPRNTQQPGTYSAKNIIIATGARPRVLSGLEPDGNKVLTYFEAMKLQKIPKTLLVIGSGAIGMEFASIYSGLGSQVTIVEVLPEILPQEDPEIAQFVRDAFGKRGVEILTSTKVGDLNGANSNAAINLTDVEGKITKREFENIISATGVVPNTEGIGLEALGVKFATSGISTNSIGATNISGIYAIGDVAGAPMLAHKAEHEAVACVESIVKGRSQTHDQTPIPGCIYCHPQVASIGLSEESLRKSGRKIKVGRFPFAANGKAVTMGDSAGFVKTIFDDITGELLAAHLVGPEVTELIHGFVTAIGHETTDEHLLQLVYPHPTLSEALHESVLDAQGTAIHIA